MRNATLETECRRADDPIEFVRRVLENLIKHHCNDAFVRVSIPVPGDTGPPDYIVDEVMDDETGQRQPMQGYNGRTHRFLAFDKISNWDRWTDTYMSRQEVSQLLGSLRKFTRN